MIKRYKAFSLVEVMYAILIMALILLLFMPLVTRAFHHRNQDGRIYKFNESLAVNNDTHCFASYDEQVISDAGDVIDEHNGWKFDRIQSSQKCSIYRFEVPENVNTINLTLVAGGGGGGGSAGMLYNRHDGEFINDNSFEDRFVTPATPDRINSLNMVQFPNNEIAVKNVREFAIKYIIPSAQHGRLMNTRGGLLTIHDNQHPGNYTEDIIEYTDKDGITHNLGYDKKTVLNTETEGFLPKIEGTSSADYGFVDYIVPRDLYRNLSLNDFTNSYADGQRITVSIPSSANDEIQLALNHNTADDDSLSDHEIRYVLRNGSYNFLTKSGTKAIPGQNILTGNQPEKKIQKDLNPSTDTSYYYYEQIQYRRNTKDGKPRDIVYCPDDSCNLNSLPLNPADSALGSYYMLLAGKRKFSNMTYIGTKAGRMGDGRYRYCGAGDDGYTYEQTMDNNAPLICQKQDNNNPTQLYVGKPDFESGYHVNSSCFKYVKITADNSNINNLRNNCYGLSMTYLRPSDSDSTSPAGGGGGGGGAVRITNFPVVPGEKYVIRVGAGGKGGNAGADEIFDTVSVNDQNMIPHHITMPAGYINNNLRAKMNGKNGDSGISTSVWKVTPNGEELVFMVVGGKGGGGGTVTQGRNISFKRDDSYQRIIQGIANSSSEPTARYAMGREGASAHILLTGNGNNLSTHGVATNYGRDWLNQNVRFDSNVASINPNFNGELRLNWFGDDVPSDALQTANLFRLDYAYLKRMDENVLQELMQPYWYLSEGENGDADEEIGEAKCGTVGACSKAFNFSNSVQYANIQRKGISSGTIENIYNGLFHKTYLQDNEIGYPGGLGDFSGLGGKAGCGGLFMGNRQGIVRKNSDLIEAENDADKKLISKKFIIKLTGQTNGTAYNVSDYYDNCNITTPNGQTAKFVEPDFRAQRFGQAGAGGGGGGYTIQGGPGNGADGQDGYVMIDWRK